MDRRLDQLAAHLRRSPADEISLAGRVGGSLWLVAAAATLLLPAFPQVHTALWPVPALWAAGAIVWGVAAIWLIDWRSAPWWLMPLSACIAPVAVTFITHETGGQGSPARLYCVLVLIFAASFLSIPWATVVITMSVLAWVVPVADALGLGAAAAELAIAAPIFAAVGAILCGGRALLGAMHDGTQRLSDEHHALRSIATTVAAGEDPETVCDLASAQAARLLGADGAAILQFVNDGADAILIGSWRRSGERPVTQGKPMPVFPGSAASAIYRTGLEQRLDDTSAPADDPYAKMLADNGYRTWVGVPVPVRGTVWGFLAASSHELGALREVSTQLSEFAELIGMAVANTEHVEQLSTDASTDPLTGLANHRAFQERLREELSRGRRHGEPLAVALVDVDRFKDINDAGGHALGDEVLRAVSAHLREHLRTEDLLARVGGDEFAVLLPASDAAAAATALERARRAVEAAPLQAGLPVTLSVGVCDVAHATEAEALVRFADGALYWSKEHGRNRVSVFDPETIKELSPAERIGALQRTQALAGIRALARAIDARDPATREHSDRVASLAARMAEQRGWPAERVALLHEAALVHDVGKIALPDAILLKPSRLTREEYEAVKAHPELGARMVEELLTAEQVEWILSHHERPDGGGYPRGLTGATLTEGGALIAVADAYDVMTSARVYAPARSIDDALAECRALVGAQFTADAVAALEAVTSPIYLHAQ